MRLAFAVLFLIWTTAASAQPSPPPLAPAQTSVGGQALPPVHFIATGGTISNRTGGRLTAEDLVASAKGADRYARVTFEQFSNVASSELTSA